MFNEFFLIQIISIILLIFFTNSINILNLWYLAGIYLFILGFLILLDDADIFIGFLWVIDLGVGLIFFIFILHFSNFLHQKTFFEINNKFFFIFIFVALFIILFSYFLSTPNGINFNFQIQKTWFFFINWYNYFSFFNSYNVTELHLLREVYFYNNSFNFFLINFMLFYGILTSIILCFLIKRVFIFLNLNQLININILSEINSTFFIRNQNFIRQQNSSTGTRVWEKKKYKTRF